MLVQLSTDSNISGADALSEQVQATIRDSLGPLSEHLTRVEVHLSDANSDVKAGSADKRCLMEARPAAHQPVVVSHQAKTLEQAVDGAVDKLKRSLERLFDRIKGR